jgi:hypothetical protein
VPFDLSVFLYDASLAMSAVAVVLFLWLMRERRGRRGKTLPPSAPRRDASESRRTE